MRRIARIFSTTILLMGIGVSCQEELAERYQNPNHYITPTVGEFFTAMLNNDRIRPSYWNMSTFVNWHVGVYSQSVSYINAQTMYQQNEAYIQDRWDDYYRPGPNGSGVMANYREIEKAYNNLSTIEKTDAVLFLQAAKIVLFEQTAQMVDLWGDIPFSEAGGLNLTGEIIYPKFDSAKLIYTTMIGELKMVSQYFADAKWSTGVLNEFAKQDILLSGDIGRWQRYCNSLRLRLLMRISFVNEEYAKAEVTEMLGNPSRFPMLNTLGYDPRSDDVLLFPLATYSDDLHQAFTDWLNYSAPYYALEQVLKPAEDLRIPVLYDKYGTSENGEFKQNAEYNGLSQMIPMNEQKENQEHFAILDSTTFLFNTKLPGVVFTASEVNFLRAEAYERWGGGDPEIEYFEGIKNSIQYYYYLNNLNTVNSNNIVAPANKVVESFLASNTFLAYTGTSEDRLAKIWTQKWLHLGFLQASENWAELRRTSYPRLQFNPAPLIGYELPPSRLTYPGNEKTYNENYFKISSADQRDAKIFWQIK